MSYFGNAPNAGNGTAPEEEPFTDLINWNSSQSRDQSTGSEQVSQEAQPQSQTSTEDAPHEEVQEPEPEQQQEQEQRHPRPQPATTRPAKRQRRSRNNPEPNYSDVVRAQMSSTSRTAQACDRCKARKMKCDSRPMSCENCTLAGAECVHVDRVTGTVYRRGELEMLRAENHVLKVENRRLKMQLGLAGKTLARQDGSTLSNGYQPNPYHLNGYLPNSTATPVSSTTPSNPFPPLTQPWQQPTQPQNITNNSYIDPTIYNYANPQGAQATSSTPPAPSTPQTYQPGFNFSPSAGQAQAGNSILPGQYGGGNQGVVPPFDPQLQIPYGNGNQEAAPFEDQLELPPMNDDFPGPQFDPVTGFPHGFP